MVCGSTESKYKCPACLIRYCSSACYAAHAAACPPDVAQPDSFVIDKLPSSRIDLRDEDVAVQPEMLEKLGSSTELLFLLRNPALRDYLTFVNTTHHPRGFMKLAMQEPLFVEFADACLKALHPELLRQPEMSAEDVKEAVEEALDRRQ